MRWPRPTDSDLWKSLNGGVKGEHLHAMFLSGRKVATARRPKPKEEGEEEKGGVSKSFANC